MRLQLAELLGLPLQRVTRYPLLLTAVLRYTFDPLERCLLEDIIEALEEALRLQNSVVCASESRTKVQWLDMQIEWPSVADASPNVCAACAPSFHGRLGSVAFANSPCVLG